jgi:hypothetical protein
VKYYSREGFVQHEIKISDEDPEEIIREELNGMPTTMGWRRSATTNNRQSINE